VTAPADSDLLSAVRAALAPRAVRSIDRRPSEYRTSFALEELDVEVNDGEKLALMFKDLGARALTPAARAAKPGFLRDPLREIEVYRELLAPAQLGTPAFYGAETDPARGRYWLFVERVAGVELYQVGERSTWEYVARWLARMHAQLEPCVGRAPHLVDQGADYFRLWPERARRFAAGGTRLLAHIAGRYDSVATRLAELPRTVIHGEFYASNVLVDSTTTPRRVAPVDWEQAAVGPGLIDLAAHASGRWTQSDRLAITAAYAHEMGLTSDDVGRDLDLCRLHLALQWLGWSEEWSPPAEHAHDWLREAEQITDTIGL